MLKYYYNKGQSVNGLLIVEQISIPTKKGKSKEKGYIVQSIMYPDAPTYKVKESNLRWGKGDAYASGRRVLVSFLVVLLSLSALPNILLWLGII